jgi:hypothetical protein
MSSASVYYLSFGTITQEMFNKAALDLCSCGSDHYFDGPRLNVETNDLWFSMEHNYYKCSYYQMFKIDVRGKRFRHKRFVSKWDSWKPLLSDHHPSVIKLCDAINKLYPVVRTLKMLTADYINCNRTKTKFVPMPLECFELLKEAHEQRSKKPKKNWSSFRYF